jgi:hypothetical protein
MEDEDVIKAKKLLNSIQLSSLEKATLCRILSEWYTKLYEAEYSATLMKATWEKIIK